MTTLHFVNRATSLLVGTPLSGTFRVADMEMFEFGDQIPFKDRQGRARTAGEFRLHVQSPWRIVKAGRVLVGFEDVAFAPGDETAERDDAGRDGLTRRDELIARLLATTTSNDRIVSSSRVARLGDLTLAFQNGSELQVFRATSNTDAESWRLIRPDGSHVVVAGRSLEVRAPVSDRPGSKS